MIDFTFLFYFLKFLFPCQSHITHEDGCNSCRIKLRLFCVFFIHFSTLWSKWIKSFDGSTCLTLKMMTRSLNARRSIGFYSEWMVFLSFYLFSTLRVALNAMKTEENKKVPTRQYWIGKKELFPRTAQQNVEFMVIALLCFPSFFFSAENIRTFYGDFPMKTR